MRRKSSAAGKEKLLAAAERLFAALGFDGVTTKLLATESGLTIGAIYHHFDSKLTVYQAALEYSFGKLPLAPANLFDQSNDLKAQLKALIAWFSESIGSDNDPAKLLRRELLEPHMNAPLSDLEAFVEPLNHFKTLMTKLAPEIDADLIQATIISLAFGISNLKGLEKLLPALSSNMSSTEKIADYITDLIFSGLKCPTLHNLENNSGDNSLEPPFTIAVQEFDFPDTNILAVILNGWHIIISRIDGEYHAMNDRCTHAASQLSTGRVRRDHIMCPLHGARFELKTGKCAGGAHRDIRTFPVKIENGAIWVQTPDKSPTMDELPVIST